MISVLPMKSVDKAEALEYVDPKWKATIGVIVCYLKGGEEAERWTDCAS